jgi:beta-glucosidase/6-phospho-beta-glucosidase/beta-galactosidase
MTPNATLHHFTHPQWFDELGGFTKAENIQLFVNFAVKVRLRDLGVHTIKSGAPSAPPD